MRVWVTRAEPGAAATAGRLVASGHLPLVAPLLAVHPLPVPESLPEGIGALAFTSANGVRAFAAAFPERDWPVFTTGEATAAAARAEGFSRVTSAAPEGGDVDGLGAALARAAPSGLILHPSARERAGDLRARLAEVGLRVATLPLYETRAAEALAPAAAEALDGRALHAVILHSPRAARTLAARLDGRPAAERAGVRAFGLSPACLRPLGGLGFASLEAARRPDEASLLDRMSEREG